MPKLTKYKPLSLEVVELWLPEAERKGVSERARSEGQFIEWFKWADGKIENLPEFWRVKREGFCARFDAQDYHDRKLWEYDLQISRWHLAMVMWAYSPDKSKRGIKRLLAGPRDDYTGRGSGRYKRKRR
mgnify:CR=1 FL=1